MAGEVAWDAVAGAWLSRPQCRQSPPCDRWRQRSFQVASLTFCEATREAAEVSSELFATKDGWITVLKLYQRILAHTATGAPSALRRAEALSLPRLPAVSAINIATA